MNDPQPQFLVVGCGDKARRIAHLNQSGTAPGLLWVPGFNSDMISTKASMLSRWCAAHGRAYTRFDYSGHGQSEGRFEDGTLSRWLEETAAVFRDCTSGSQIVIGSSMGGHIALLLLKRLLGDAPQEAARMHGLVLIAPAWDMTENLMWTRFSEEAKATIMTDGVWLRPSAYGDPYPITRALIEDGRKNLVGTQPWNPGKPVEIIQGRLDPDVPYAHAARLESLLTGGHVKITEVADGEHRLSRPQDLAILFAAIEKLS